MVDISHRPKLLVLSGGMSEEYELSLLHGNEAKEVLEANLFEVKQVAVTKQGEWLQDGITRTPEQIMQHMDGVYIALHGEYGEDGQVQRIIERNGLTYNGSKPYQSSIGMHKMLTKEHINMLPIKTPRHMRVTRSGVNDLNTLVSTIGQLFGPQYIAKPMRGGSSIGQREVSGALHLKSALQSMLEVYDDILVEERVDGTTVTCGVIEDFRSQKRYFTPLIELRYEDEVKDVFKAEKIAPANFSTGIKVEIANITNLVHTQLQLTDISRSDFIVTDSGEIYFLEVNTLPAITKNSPLMAGLNALGASQEEIFCHLCGKHMV